MAQPVAINKNNYFLDKIIGSGAYGKVWRGTARGLLLDEPVTTVAIKTVNRSANDEHLKVM